MSACGGWLGQNLTRCLHLVGGMHGACSERRCWDGTRSLHGGHNLLHAPAPSAWEGSHCMPLIPLPAPSCVQIPESRVTVVEDPRLQVSSNILQIMIAACGTKPWSNMLSWMS